MQHDDADVWYTSDNTPPGTPQELLNTLNDELKAFRLMWKLFNKYSTDSVTGSTILPVTLSGFSYEIVHHNYHEAHGTAEDCTPDDTIVLSGYAAFAAIFFKFGQFCYRHGILDSNLTELLDAAHPEETFSDEALRKFMDNG